MAKGKLRGAQPASSSFGAAGAALVWAAGFSCNSSSSASAGCDSFFQALVNCSALPGPAAVSHEETRFDQACSALLSLPGMGYTAAVLARCASAIQKEGCYAFFQDPACQQPAGRLGAGAECSNGAQCQSGDCLLANESGCGACSVPLAVGEACGVAGATCVPGTTCDGVTGQCVVVTYGGAGTPCGQPQSPCGPGLSCRSGQCAALGAMGASCAQSTDCQWTLSCTGSPNGTCGPQGAAGAACQSDTDCASPLGCGNGMCGAITFAQAGQACGGGLVRCLAGACDLSNGSGTCPTVIADGQTCQPNDPTTTCDFEASCVTTGSADAAGATFRCALGNPVCM